MPRMDAPELEILKWVYDELREIKPERRMDFLRDLIRRGSWT